MKAKKSLLALLLLAATSMFFGCGDHYDDGINWDGDNGGTLELVNGSNKDMILFIGQTPAKSNMIGGVRSGATRKFDISRQVDDFAVGGYTILRGVTKEEYSKNTDPTKAKIEFTAMVTYRSGTMFRYNIDKNYMGDNGFRVVNRTKIGMELRKDSPDGEKVAYLGALEQNQIVYTQTTDGFTLFPVYVFYNSKTQEVTQLKAQSILDAVPVGPRELGPSSASIPTYYFPNDEKLTWQYIVGQLKPSVAYVRVVNNISNQGVWVTNALNNRLVSQNGYDLINSGENLVYEVEGGEEGIGLRRALTVVVYGYPISVFFEGETTSPLIENGYDYTVSIDYLGGGLDNSNNFKATIIKGSKRDISDQINSL